MAFYRTSLCFIFYSHMNMCSEQKNYSMDYVDGTYCNAKIAFNIWLTVVISHVWAGL